MGFSSPRAFPIPVLPHDKPLYYIPNNLINSTEADYCYGQPVQIFSP